MRRKPIVLDAYEREIEAHVGKSVAIKNVKRKMAMIQKAAVRHAVRKKSITIRIPELDLEAIKLIASKNGMPYQTYLNMIIHREASAFLR